MRGNFNRGAKIGDSPTLRPCFFSRQLHRFTPYMSGYLTYRLFYVTFYLTFATIGNIPSQREIYFGQTQSASDPLGN